MSFNRVIMGIAERAADRSGTSIYCSAIHIEPDNGEIINIHRKLMPTFGERMVWGIGDGHGLKTFKAGKKQEENPY